VIQVIGDSKIIIEWLKEKYKLQITSLMGWMDRLKVLKNSFREHFTHVYMDLNMDAYHLSKKALTKTEGKLDFNRWVEGNEGPTLSINLF